MKLVKSCEVRQNVFDILTKLIRFCRRNFNLLESNSQIFETIQQIFLEIRLHFRQRKVLSLLKSNSEMRKSNGKTSDGHSYWTWQYRIIPLLWRIGKTEMSTISILILFLFDSSSLDKSSVSFQCFLETINLVTTPPIDNLRINIF